VRTGILGGTFDPIHIAHLHAAECALHQYRLDRVLIVPAGDPWQKTDLGVTPAQQRFEMCRLAVDEVDGLVADDREIVRAGPTYTADTLDTFPEDEELFMVVGSDALAGLHTWHRWEAVASRVTILVAPRPGAPIADEHDQVLDMSPLDVSSTDIRKRAADGRPYRFLVTAPVHDYIETHGLYRKSGRDDMVERSSAAEDQS
jgi:nicotinate-nucleotide adenylyltransferase